MKNKEIPNERKEIIEKIKLYEQLGGEYYFKDVENDPPTKVLMPDDVDYLNKKLSSKIKNSYCKHLVSKMLKKYAVEHEISVIGMENLNSVKSGAVITTNHFHHFDSAPIIYALKHDENKHKYHIIIREGNYQIPGFLGFLLKNFNTFPLSSNMKTTMKLNKAIDTVLTSGHFLIVYPEQAMWWKYKKPRCYRDGAFRWASRNNVPVIPCFTTMEDMNELEDDGLPKQKLTLHIGKPIYPNKELSEKENANLMLKLNKEFTVNTYENFYGVKYDLKTE